ncbi:hypothetical protein NIE88_15900 [Sporolactobacillus shoreicorticis]|uniref:Uncharacterized protein n=1 Tax=Sporolactobacillus shoreicorticis TaxID=1923877 RepID=A0ABW5S008_9BACL|nr:hypothetical protein [Sporolactobacillus shoreicorticis]MCO7127252.1 hypothetical protein [Sporolactobacillus shoreicorticis]
MDFSNLPVGVLAVITGIRTMPNLERQSVSALDFLGMILAPIAFASIAYGVSEGGTSWTSAKTITGLVVGGIALILFVIVELRRKQPLLELRVFRSADFTRWIIVQWITQIALFGTMFLILLFLQQGKGFSARPVVITGLVFITSAAYLLSRISAEDGSRALILPLALLGGEMGLSHRPVRQSMFCSSGRLDGPLKSARCQ